MRWILRIVFGLLALVVAAVAVLFLLPAERIAGLVTDRFEAATGRAMTLQGDVRPTLWPELGVNTGPVTIANAGWSDAGPMLSADRLSVGVDIMALLGGDVRISRIEIEAPRVVLEVASDGRGNWEMVRAGGEAVTATSGGEVVVAGGVPQFTLDRAVISGGSLTFIDRASGSRTELSSVDATLRLPDFEGAADLDLAAVMNGQRFAVTGQIAAFAGFLGAGAVPVTAEFAVGGNKVAFQGRAGLDPVAAGGRLEAELDDMGALFALIGLAAPDLPRGLGREAVVSGAVTVTQAGAITLRDATIRLDQNTLTGAADITLAERPRIVATLSAGALDLSEAVTDEDGASGTGSAEAASGWSRDPIDVSGLQAVDAEIALAAASVDLGLAQLGRTNILVTLDKGRAVTEIREIQAYDGTVTGTLVVNSRGGLSTRADLSGKGVRIKPLLVQLADWDRLQTTGDVRMNLLGVGNSVDALMNSLSGEGAIKFGQGEIAGLDLVGMLRNLDASYIGEGAKTIFESIGATFTVDQGVLTNADLAFLAPLITASGKGRIGLGAQTLDYRLEGQTGGGIRVPVLITGTWANPKFRLDLESLAEERIEVEVEKVKEQAEEAVIERLNEELGVDIQTKEDIDDVLKKELEERARDGLLDLLGGRN